MDALHTLFGNTTEVCGLLTSDSVVWKDIAVDLVNSDTFRAKLKELQYKAAAAGRYILLLPMTRLSKLYSL